VAHPEGKTTITTAPQVGVGIIVRRDEKVLLGLRQGSHGAGEWALPGGKVNPGEHPLQTAQRELAEETGLVVRDPRVVPFWSNDVFPEADRHFVTLYVVGTWDGREPQLLEPERCLEWRWSAWADMPRPRFGGIDELQARFPRLAEL
jgi:8-oxo-dGTP diphosphatase